MQRVFVAVVLAAALQTAHFHAQTAAPASPVSTVTLDGVAKALGASTRLTSLQFSATGSNHAYGQAWKADMPWPAVQAVLTMRTKLSGAPPVDLNFCRVSYNRLKVATAQQVLRFHRMRLKSG